jgi:RHS repeat-associated protein
VTSLTTPNGKTHEFIYSEQELLCEYRPPALGSSVIKTTGLNGELASKTTGSETTNYTFDVYGNLYNVQQSDKTISYQFDALDRRVAKFVSDNLISRYVWQDQLRLAAELNADGSMKKQFVYADGVNSPEYMIFDGKRYFFVKDHRGSINLVVNVDSGEVVQRMSYSEFGEVVEDTNPGFQPFGFAGGLYDTDTKLVKFGVRDYDGKIGRWLSKDPIRFDGGDTNLYGYVLNDPIDYIDPLGTEGSWIAALICKVTKGRCCQTSASEAAKCSVTLPDEEPKPDEKPKNKCQTKGIE